MLHLVAGAVPSTEISLTFEEKDVDGSAFLCVPLLLQLQSRLVYLSATFMEVVRSSSDISGEHMQTCPC